MRPEWFAPKRFGYGAGLPIAWQGWAVLAAFVLLLGLAQRLPAVPRLLASVVLVAALIVVAWFTTAGGWHWRG